MALTTSEKVTTAAPRPAERRVRGDVDGLRALAIILVVGFHASLPGFPGGYIGVDVFFVISGYLITRNLLREASGSGHVGLLRFWGKRIRRLVPAMFLMIVVVFGLCMLVMSPLDLGGVARDGRAAALYVSNIAYARQATDYFAPEIEQSVFLHTWSLGVEEQFYLLWPLLFVGACLAARRARARLLPVLVVGFSITLVASLAFCLVLTANGSPWAFFSLPTRAWEFAAAGLLACWAIPTRLQHRALQVGAAVVGLGLILFANAWLSDTTPYPGRYALLPVVGTLLVIFAGEGSYARGSNPVSGLLALRPAQWVGRVSYSWYLWHWPLILLMVTWRGTGSRRYTLAAALVALAIAAVVYHLYENPVRFNRALVGSKPKTYALGAALTVTVLVASLGVAEYGKPDDTGLTELAEVRAARRNLDCPRALESPSGISYCEGGPADADTTVFVLGDSHARHWSPALMRAADELEVRLVLRWRGACASTNPPVAEGADPGCETFRRDTDELLAEMDPDVVVFANSNAHRVPGGARAWARSLRQRIAEMQGAGRSVGVIADTPRLTTDPITCLSAGGTVESCSVSRADAFPGRNLELHNAEQRVVSEFDDVAMLDVNDILCPHGRCVVKLNGTYVYTDIEHMYDKFVVTLTPQVVAFLEQLLPDS